MTLNFTASTATINRGRAPIETPPYVMEAIKRALKEPNGTVESAGTPEAITEAVRAFRRFRDANRDEYHIIISPRDKAGRPVKALDKAVSLVLEVKKVSSK